MGIAGEYATIKDAWDWLLSIDPLLDSYTFTIISDITEIATTTGAVTAFGGSVVRITADISHGGNPNAGRKVSIGSDINIKPSLNDGSTATLQIDNINFIKTAQNTAQLSVIYLNGGHSINYNNLIINENGFKYNNDHGLF